MKETKLARNIKKNGPQRLGPSRIGPGPNPDYLTTEVTFDDNLIINIFVADDSVCIKAVEMRNLFSNI